MPGPQLRSCRKCQAPVIFNKDFFNGVEENFQGKRWSEMSEEEKADASNLMREQNIPMFLNPDGSDHDCKAKNAPSAESSASASKATSAASSTGNGTAMQPSTIEFMASFLQVLNRIATNIERTNDLLQELKQNGRKGAKP